MVLSVSEVSDIAITTWVCFLALAVLQTAKVLTLVDLPVDPSISAVAILQALLHAALVHIAVLEVDHPTPIATIIGVKVA